MVTHDPTERPTIVGWREWLELPDLGIAAVKAKIDTGARTSSLHAFDVQVFYRGGRQFVRFSVHPLQRSTERSVTAEVPLLEFRPVRSSSGHQTQRPVIVTRVALHGQCWPVELTLADRDAMGFRMLLGRQALRHRFVVDPGRSYAGGKPPLALKKAARPARKRRRKGPDGAS